MICRINCRFSDANGFTQFDDAMILFVGENNFFNIFYVRIYNSARCQTLHVIQKIVDQFANFWITRFETQLRSFENEFRNNPTGIIPS